MLKWLEWYRWVNVVKETRVCSLKAIREDDYWGTVKFCGTPQGFPGGAVVKNPPANAEDATDAGSIPGSGRSPWVGNGKPTPVCLPGKFPQRSLTGYSPWGCLVHDWACKHVKISSDRFPSLPVGPSMWPSVTEISGSIPIHGWNAGGKLHLWPSLRQVSFSRSLLPTVYDCFIMKFFWIPRISNLHCGGLPWFPGSYRWKFRISSLWWCHFVATELCVLDTEMSSPQDLEDIPGQYLEGRFCNTSSRNMRKSYLWEGGGSCFKTGISAYFKTQI